MRGFVHRCLAIGHGAGRPRVLRQDIWRVVLAWFAGLRNSDARGADYRIGWAVIVATIPIGIVGFAFRI